MDAKALANWIELKAKLKQAEEAELTARLAIVTELFPEFEEGTNTRTCDGFTVKFRHVINRTISKPELATIWGELEKLDVPLDQIIETKPTLVLPIYRRLMPAQRVLFDSAMTIKPGTPQLEVLPPKKK